MSIILNFISFKKEMVLPILFYIFWLFYFPFLVFTLISDPIDQTKDFMDNLVHFLITYLIVFAIGATAVVGVRLSIPINHLEFSHRAKTVLVTYLVLAVLPIAFFYGLSLYEKVFGFDLFVESVMKFLEIYF